MHVEHSNWEDIWQGRTCYRVQYLAGLVRRHPVVMLWVQDLPLDPGTLCITYPPPAR